MSTIVNVRMGVLFLVGLALSSIIAISLFLLFAFMTPHQAGTVELEPLVSINRLNLSEHESTVNLSLGLLSYILIILPVLFFIGLGIFLNLRKSQTAVKNISTK